MTLVFAPSGKLEPLSLYVDHIRNCGDSDGSLESAKLLKSKRSTRGTCVNQKLLKGLQDEA